MLGALAERIIGVAWGFPQRIDPGDPDADWLWLCRRCDEYV